MEKIKAKISTVSVLPVSELTFFPFLSEQEITVAVLPFFHIYAMNTVMTCGLQAGVQIVTLPKFEPEMYIKALATYKV